MLGKRLTLPVFRLLRTYVLSHGGFRTLSRSAKCEHGDAIQRYGSEWGGKMGEMGERQGTIIVVAMRSFFFFFVSRNALLFHGACVIQL